MISEKPDQILWMDEDFYKVASQSRDGSYNVKLRKNGTWSCECKDYYYRRLVLHEITRCKHICAVQFSLKIREQVAARVIEPITGIDACLFCKSGQIVKKGLRHNKYGDIQKFRCLGCGKWFTVNFGFEHTKHNPQGITTAMQLYFSGESLCNTARSLRLLGVNVCHRTVYISIEKYKELMERYVDQITPQASDTWATDELSLKVKGNMKYLYAMMDEQTRLWIAQEVAETKYIADVRQLFQAAKVIAGKTPKTLVSDGAPNFHEAWQKEFYTAKLETRTEHIRHIRLQGAFNNNKMERMNGEIRDRELCMRTLETADTPILSGMRMYHNFVKPHMALKEKTSAELAGIKVQGDNKWLTLIQNAAQTSKKTGG